MSELTGIGGIIKGGIPRQQTANEKMIESFESLLETLEAGDLETAKTWVKQALELLKPDAKPRGGMRVV